jgi:hypothetical protein
MNKDLRNSLLISILYVGSGTLALLFANSSNTLIPLVLLLTIPVTVISFGIAYTQAESTMLILAVQLIVFLLFWAFLYGRFKKRTMTGTNELNSKTD